jgi:hypothetical protein
MNFRYRGRSGHVLCSLEATRMTQSGHALRFKSGRRWHTMPRCSLNGRERMIADNTCSLRVPFILSPNATFAVCPRYVPRNCRNALVKTASIAMLRFVQRELVTAGCITFFTTYSPICCPISVPTRVENR